MSITGNAAFIGGDWGTSRLRLFLCDDTGAVLVRAEGPGAAAGDCAKVFAELTAKWDAKLPAILCGMVGSTIGWREVPYLACPSKAGTIAGAMLRFESDGRMVFIVPGLFCRNLVGMPDVMRGEETQIFGVLRLQPELAQARHLICLPGTHTKWAEVTDGAVVRFQTALSGELYDLLSRHSVLVRDSGAVDVENGAFREALDLARDQRAAGLSHLLFSTRARQVTGEMAKADAASYLSGLVIGADVQAALSLFPEGPVHLVCSPALAALYGRALAHYGQESVFIDGDAAALAGLTHIHSELKR
jgi:2-dehydro-3-deoxygalactonokinase